MRHSLPDRSVTDETIEDAYVSFIFYCNPGVPPDVTTGALRDAFKTPPRSGGKSFSVYHLYQLICKLETKEIKTWAELALKLGVEPPDQESGQSSQKIQQYAVRLKRWMHSMHVDAFFDYLMSRQHPYWIDVPSEDCPVSELERDGVAAKDDMALRALLPEIKPRRGRRRPDDDADQQLLSSMPPMQRSRLTDGVDDSVGVWTTQPPTNDAYGFSAAGPTSHSAGNTPQPQPQQPQQPQQQQQQPQQPQTSSQPQQVARNSPLPVQVSSYDISDQRGSMSTSPGAPWAGGDMGTPLGYPQSALTPSSRHGFWDEEPSRSTGTSPMKTARSSGRRHGAKVVSSAWRGNNGATGSGKTRGRPPLNRVGSGNRSSDSPLSATYPSIEQQSSSAAYNDAPSYPSHLHSASATTSIPAPAPADLNSVYATSTMQHMTSNVPVPSAPAHATYRPGRQGRVSLQLPGQNSNLYQMGGLATVTENPPLDPITNTYVDSGGPSTYYGSYLGKLVEVEPLYFSNMLDTQFAGGRPTAPAPSTSVSAATSMPSIPSVPSVPSAPSVPSVPSVPSMPSMPSMPSASSAPPAPSVSTVSTVSTASTEISMPIPPTFMPPSLIPMPGEAMDPTTERMAKELTDMIKANANSNDGASSYFHMPFTFDQMQDRTNVDETLLYFLQMVFSADWYDATGHRTGPGTWEEANGICETVMNNMIQTAPTYESFISSMAMISGSKVLMNHTRLLLKRGERDETCSHFTVCWELRFGHIASRYNMVIQVPLPLQTRLVDRTAPPPIPPSIARKLGLPAGARGSGGGNGGSGGGGGGGGSANAGGNGNGNGSGDVEHSSKGRGPEPPPAMITTTTQIELDGTKTQLPPKIVGATEMGERGNGTGSGPGSGSGSGNNGAATTPIPATNIKRNLSDMSMQDVLHNGINGGNGGGGHGGHGGEGGGMGGPGGSSNGPGNVAMTPNGSEDMPQHYTPTDVSPEERARVWERRYRDLLRVVQRQEVQLETLRAHIISGLREVA